MQTIIHLSDFHIKATMPEPSKHPVFSSLVEKLKTMSLENPILLYGGDVIDTKAICSSIDASLSESEKAELWDQSAKKSFDKAKSYFDYLIEALHITEDRIIICCGNHDINPFLTNTIQINCPANCAVAAYNPARFKQFSEFCSSLQKKKKYTSETYFREIGNLNFLILNTNWINKWIDGRKQSLCINCDQIDALINAKHSKLHQAIAQRSMRHNVLVAHAPSMDFCEFAIAAYPENKYHYVEDSLNQLFGLKLYGDKHTGKAYHSDYIVGAPLNEKQISFGIHQFGEKSHRYIPILYSDGAWQIKASESEIDNILTISKGSISDQALLYLFGSKDDTDLATKIAKFDQVRSDSHWKALTKLFKNFAEIQKPQGKGAGIPISYTGNFIDKLSTLIADSRDRGSITIRGDTRMGKSMCMSVLYMNLLHGFICGNYPCLPVYINLERIIASVENQNRNSSKFLIEIEGKVTDILDRGVSLARSIEAPACCIIDGLNEFILYPNANIEKMIAGILSKRKGQYRNFVYCIDKGYNQALGSTPQHYQQNSDYVVYFSEVLTNQINSNRRYTDVIKAFCTLKNASVQGKIISTVKENIVRMHISAVGTGLLVDFWNDLSTTDCTSFFSLLDTYTSKYIPIASIVDAAKACYAYHRGVTYPELMSTFTITNEIFDLFRTHHLLSRYLLAVNYVDQIRHTPDCIQKESCLNQLYNHEECHLIREYIRINNMQSRVIKFAQCRYADLTLEGKATITYILGRLSVDNKDKDRVSSILDQQEKILCGSGTVNAQGVTVHHSIANRSILLSRVCVAKNPSKLLHEYLNTLLADSDERRINRTFYLQFYSDRPDANDDSILEGFDFYNTYNTLALRLKKWRETSVHYTLLELELFTLCDLLQIRLDNAQALSRRSNNTVPSFFYSVKYTETIPSKASTSQTISVLSFMVDIIDTYLESHNQSEQNTLFQKYLHIQLEQFRANIEKLAKGPLSAKDDTYKPRKLLEQLSKLSQIKRVGWSLPNPVTTVIPADDFEKLQSEDPVYETTLQHTYEAFLIALLYLPNKSPYNDTYSKQKILNLILVHDLGETYVGDIIPQYVNYQEARQQEQRFCENLFLEGMHQDVGDMVDYFQLWESWCSGAPDYNAQVAKDIDKIQMLYKLLKLLDANKPNLGTNRVQDFWKSRLDIKTSEGKAIFNLLVLNDPNAIRLGKQHGLSIGKLS